MARSAKDLTHLFRNLWDSQIMNTYDDSISPLKFRKPFNNNNNDDKQKQQILTIGYYFSDGLIEPSYASK